MEEQPITVEEFKAKIIAIIDKMTEIHKNDLAQGFPGCHEKQYFSDWFDALELSL